MFDATFSEALGNIYDAAIRPGRWRRALDGIAKVGEADAAALMVQQVAGDARDKQLLNSRYLDFSRSLAGSFYALRHGTKQKNDWAYLAQQEVRTLIRDTDMGIPAEVLDRRGDYAYLRRKLGVARRVGVRLNGDAGWFDGMSLAFPVSIPYVPEAAMMRLEPILPHIAKSLELARTFSELKRRYAAVLSALNQVDVALAIAIPTGEIIVKNTRAEEIFSEKDGIRLRADGRIECSGSKATSAIAKSIVRNGATASGNGNTSGEYFTIPRPSGRADYVIDVAPLSASDDELDRMLNGALLTIVDLAAPPNLEVEKFTTVYGLSPSEADVCAMILQGYDLREIARHRDTTTTTAKNQLAAVFAKTGMASRADLVRLALRMLPPVK